MKAARRASRLLSGCVTPVAAFLTGTSRLGKKQSGTGGSRQISVSLETSWTLRGHERDAFRMGTFAAIDFETATAERSSACAVGLLVVDDWKAVDGGSWLIQPPGNRYNAFNTRIHRLTASSTADSPPFAEVWPEVESRIGGRLVVAHNMAFDMSVLQQSAKLTGLKLAEMRFACTYRLARLTWPNRRSYKLNDLANDLGIELDHHDAQSDASAAGELVKHICNAHGVGSLEKAAEVLGYGIGWLRSYGYSGVSTASASARTKGPSKAKKRQPASAKKESAVGNSTLGKILGRKPPGEPGRSFKATHPLYAKAWHTTDNKGVKPSDVFVEVDNKLIVSWKPPCGHVFRRQIKNWIQNPVCPECGTTPEEIQQHRTKAQPLREVRTTKSNQQDQAENDGGIGIGLGCFTLFLFYPAALGIMALVAQITPDNWELTTRGVRTILVGTPVLLFTLLWSGFNRRSQRERRAEEARRR